jgi:hypothetical protein
MVDTDGCLYIHKHTVNGKEYQNIGFCFTSYSPPLLSGVCKILNEHGIKPHVTDKSRRIYLYGKNSVVKYLKVFGTSNPRILSKFLEWERISSLNTKES